MTEFALGMFAPFLMIVFLTRVTYNHYISALLTLGIITSIHIKYYEPSFVVFFWGLSLTIGFIFSQFMVKQLKKK